MKLTGDAKNKQCQTMLYIQYIFEWTLYIGDFFSDSGGEKKWKNWKRHQIDKEGRVEAPNWIKIMAF
jgi:hypothetical protein